MNVLKPREAVPALEVETLDGTWSLADQNPENFTLVVFYRGLHCPICTKYIGELDRLKNDFDEIGGFRVGAEHRYSRARGPGAAELGIEKPESGLWRHRRAVPRLGSASLG